MRIGLCVVIGVAVMALTVGIVPVLATEFRSGSSVTIAEGTVIDDELYASAGDMAIGGRVSGDLLAVGGSISMRGTVGQSASLAGGNVDVSGSVGSNLRAAGGQVSVSGSISDNVSIFGGTVVLPRNSTIGRDLQIAGGDLRIEGNVGRNLRVNGGQVRLDGEVGGDARVNAGRLTVGPSAVIRGDLIYTSSQKADIAAGARILGKTVFRPTPKPARPAAWVRKSSVRLLSLAALFLIGVIAIALAPRSVEATADRVTRAPWISLLIGFLILVVVPAAVVILLITLIGIPLALILLAVYLVMVYVSRVFTASGFGRWILAKFGRPVRPGGSLYASLLVGLLVLWILAAIPYVGWLINLIAILLGLGAFAAQRFAFMKDLRQEGKL